MNRPGGGRIVLLVEGDTERAAKDHLKKFLDQRADKEGIPKVGLHVVPFNGSILKANLYGRVEMHLKKDNTVGVVALADLYPDFRGMSADEARAHILAQMPQDNRCRAQVAKHDFEAWLLPGWQIILDHAHIDNKKPWGQQPEEINHDKPPAHRMRDLFDHHAKPPRKYKKPIDGAVIFRKLALETVADACPEFRQFLNCLLVLAGCAPLEISTRDGAEPKPPPWQDALWAQEQRKQLTKNILDTFERRSLSLDEMVRARIEACMDTECLGRWALRADIVASAAEIFIETE